MFFLQNKKNNTGGFTLIELLVSVGLFATVMTMSAGIILSVINGNKKAQQINSVANNLNFAVESMTRDLKTGYDYYCDENAPTVKDPIASRGCGSGASDVIRFISTITGEERVVFYKFFPDGTDGGYLSKRICEVGADNASMTNCNQYSRVTSPDIDLKEVSFYVKAPIEGDDDQPGALIVIRGTSKIERNAATDFNIQTYVSQRLLNI